MVCPRYAAIATAAVHDGTAFKTWRCVLCAFVYDEVRGLPEEGIASGTRWKYVPEGWYFPDCAASKGDFEMVEV